MDFQYLKDEQHYIDRYDTHTIKECLDYYSSIKAGFDKQRDSEEFKKYSQEKFDQEVQKILNILVNTLKGENFRNKAQTIQKWMDRDRREQEKYDNAIPPTGIICKECNAPTKLTNKDLHNSFEENSKMVFTFRCVKCNKGQMFYEDRTEWLYEPSKCPKCNSPLNDDLKKVDEVLTTTYSCPKCSFTKEDSFDFKKSRSEREKEEAREKNLLSEYREMFCMSEKDGQEYIDLGEAMKVGDEVYKEELKKYDSPVYQRSTQLKKTSIVELEKLLTDLLEKEKYIKLSFGNPEMEKYVIVPFTIQDADSSRKENISTSNLHKLIKDALEDTNWRLMNENITYRLGYLTGRLKGYEGEEAMLELAGKKKEPIQPQIESEKRTKYNSHYVVQFSRLKGQMQGIENSRKRRLEKDPEGFHVEDEKTYTCPICGNIMSGTSTWYDKWGMKCINCKRNIDDGVIPPEICDYKTKGETWYTKYGVEEKTGLHPSSIGKFIRNGELKTRQLKDERGFIYFNVFMADEIQDFIKKYQKNNIKR